MRTSVLSHDIVKIALAALALFLVWRLKFVVIVLFVAFMVTVILLPFVRRLQKIHIPAIFAVFIPLVIFSSLITLLIIYVAPALREQFSGLVSDIPGYINNLPFADELDINASTLRETVSGQFGDLSQLLFNLGAAMAQVLFGAITVIILAIYWLSGYDKIRQTLITYLPKVHQKHAEDIWNRIEHKLSKWFLGQLMVSISVGLMVWLVALLLGLPYAGTLGILAGILEIVPTIGPVAAALPAILIGLTDSFEKGLMVLAAYIIIQQIESQVLTPLLMGRAIKIHPMAIIVGFLVGSVLFGIIGALLAVPAVLMLSAFVDSFRAEPLEAKDKPPKPKLEASNN